MENDKPKMKLFVIGEPCGDPDMWSQFCERRFVLAANMDDARSMTDHNIIAEVRMDRPNKL